MKLRKDLKDFRSEWKMRKRGRRERIKSNKEAMEKKIAKDFPIVKLQSLKMLQ